MFRLKHFTLFIVIAITFSMALLSFGSIKIMGDESTVPDNTPEVSGNGLDMEKNKLYAQNDALEMYINTEDNCIITIRSIKDGSIWTTTPQAYDTDTTAEGNIRNEMVSHLLVDYVDAKNNKSSVSSRISSIKRGTYKIRKFKAGTGFQIEYDFSRESEEFIIPVNYELIDNTLRVEVLFDKVKEYGNTRITDITVLPFFLSGYQSDGGYLFLPDGSGMVMNFETTNQWASSYEEMIYGRDYSKTMMKETDSKEIISLPVYGAKIGDTAITAIIEQGDFNASLGANPAGKYCRYANAYSKFIFRQSDLTVLADKDWNAREIAIVKPAPVAINPKIRYCFSTGDEADYNGMAKIYRNYLMETKGYKRIEDTSKPPSLNIEFFGLTKKQESFLGIMVNKKVIATDFDDIQNIIEKFNQIDKININAILLGFDNGGYNGKYDKKVNFDRAVGGMNGFVKLQENAEVLHATISVAYSPMIVYQNAKFMFRFNNTAKTMDRRYIPFNTYKLSTGEMLNSGAYFLSTKKVTAYSDRYIDSSKSDNISIAFESAGNKLYTDFNENNFTDRTQIASSIRDSVENASNKGLFTIVYGGNEYTAQAARHITDIPVSSSNFDIESFPIPFYQMVMHGLVEMSSKPVNSSGNSAEVFLECLQSGTQIKYRMIGKNNDKIRESPFKFLYNCYFKNIDEIKKQQLTFIEVHKDLQNVFIERFERVGDITKTTYENGSIIYINYGVNQQTMDGVLIPAKSYQTR